MKSPLIILLFTTISIFSFGQNWDRKLLIENNIVQINEYGYWPDSVKKILSSHFYNDSGLVIKSIYYSPEPDSVGNYSYGQIFHTYKNNELVKDSSIWFYNPSIVTYFNYNTKIHKSNRKTKSIATEPSGNIYSINITKSKNNINYFSKIKYFVDGVVYKVNTIRNGDKKYTSKSVYIKDPKLNQKYCAITLSSSKDTLRSRIVIKLRRKKSSNDKYKRLKTKKLCITEFMYDINGLLIEKRKTCEKKESEGSSRSNEFYEYIKRKP